MEKIFDSHAHYNDDSFKKDYNEILQHIQNSGVGLVMNVGADINSSRLALKQAKENDFMVCSVGIHPHDAIQARDEDIMAELESMAMDNKVHAIGEAGLDYHYDDSWSPQVQKEAFIRQIKLANKLDKPLIIHTREAMQDTLDILNEYPLKNGVVHCYSGSRESCKTLVKMGMYIGFTGVITFKNARRALDSLKVVPLDRLLIETDCPYMAPEPNRGKRCDSSMLHFIAQRIADELGMTKDEIIKITNENARRLFNI